MLGPLRTLTSVRPDANPAALAATATVTGMFAATPFLIPVIAEGFGVSEGIAGGLSVAQVGGFAAANIVLSRLIAPSRRLFRMSLLVLMIADLLSAVAPGFPVLVGVRLIAGVAAGSVTWVGWTAAMASPRSIAAMSAVGPLAALIGAPIAAVLADVGFAAVYLTLAVLTVPPLLMVAPQSSGPGGRSAPSGSRSNLILLTALWLTTFSGSALFVYQTIVAREVLGLSPATVSLAFSLNAATGLLGARLSGRHRRPGVFLATAGPAALLSVLGGHPVWFFIGMGWWGFAYWMGVPGVLEMLAARSLRRGERAGDAQGALGLGRALGPVMGGGFVDGSQYASLAIAAAAGLTLAGATVVAVQEGREFLPPSDHRWRAPAAEDPGG